MNVKRAALAAAAATIADAVYGVVIYGTALAGEIAPYGGVYRPIEAVNANLPWLLVGLPLAMIAATYLYARGGRGGVFDGLCFGAGLGLLCAGYVSIGNYVVMKVSLRLTAFMAAAGLGEWLLIGAIIGVCYGAGERGRERRPV